MPTFNRQRFRRVEDAILIAPDTGVYHRPYDKGWRDIDVRLNREDAEWLLKLARKAANVHSH